MEEFLKPCAQLQKNQVAWIGNVKTENIRERRLKKPMALLKKNQKPDMK